MTEECKFDTSLLYLPGKNRNRPRMSDKTKAAVWREWGYRCAIPLCHSPGVEIHHIVPWPEATFLFGEAHSTSNLIALCPGCHAKADNEEISRHYLKDLKASLPKDQTTIQPVWLDFLSFEDEHFLLHLKEWHRGFVYKGRLGQFRDYLTQLNDHLVRKQQVGSIKRIGILATLGGVLRRQGSKNFQMARRALQDAEALAKDVKKTQWVDPVIGRICYDLGYISFLYNDYDTAIYHFVRGLENDKRAKQFVGLWITSSVRELVWARKIGFFNSQQLKENHAIFSDMDHPDARRWVTNTCIHLAEFYLKNDKALHALEHLEKASNDYDDLGLITGRGKLLHLFGVAFLKLGDLEKATNALSASLRLYKSLGQRQEFADVCYDYGRSLEQCGLRSEAIAIYKQGLSADPNMDNQTGITRCKSKIEVIGIE